jgi:hypothetical protein
MNIFQSLIVLLDRAARQHLADPVDLGQQSARSG